MVKVRIGYIAKDSCPWHEAESYCHPGGRVACSLVIDRDRESQHPLQNAHLNQAPGYIRVIVSINFKALGCPGEHRVTTWIVHQFHQPHCLLNGRTEFHQF